MSESKQDILVSGENIKSINGESILGEGNIEVQGGGSIDVEDDETALADTSSFIEITADEPTKAKRHLLTKLITWLKGKLASTDLSDSNSLARINSSVTFDNVEVGTSDSQTPLTIKGERVTTKDGSYQRINGGFTLGDGNIKHVFEEGKDTDQFEFNTRGIGESHKVILPMDKDGTIAMLDDIQGGGVKSVNGKTGEVTLSAGDVNAVDLTSNQTIKGTKTFDGGTLNAYKRTDTQGAITTVSDIFITPYNSIHAEGWGSNSGIGGTVTFKNTHRGGQTADVTETIELPVNKSGTLALTSDIPSVPQNIMVLKGFYNALSNSPAIFSMLPKYITKSIPTNNINSPTDYYSLVYFNGYYYKSYQTVVYRSSDLSTWSSVLTHKGNCDLTIVGNRLYATVGGSSYSTTNYYTTNGTSWTSFTTSYAFHTPICNKAQSIYLANISTSYYFRSTDGRTWTRIQKSYALGGNYGQFYCDGQYFYCISNYSFLLQRSSDGSTWTNVCTLPDYKEDITSYLMDSKRIAILGAVKNYLYIVNCTNDSSKYRIVIYKVDLTYNTVKLIDTGIKSQNEHYGSNLVFRNGLYIISLGGTNKYLISEDGETWTQAENYISSIIQASDKYVGIETTAKFGVIDFPNDPIDTSSGEVYIANGSNDFVSDGNLIICGDNNEKTVLKTTR